MAKVKSIREQPNLCTGRAVGLGIQLQNHLVTLGKPYRGQPAQPTAPEPWLPAFLRALCPASSVAWGEFGGFRYQTRCQEQILKAVKHYTATPVKTYIIKTETSHHLGSDPVELMTVTLTELMFKDYV